MLAAAAVLSAGDLHPSVHDANPAKCFGSPQAPIVIELFSDYQCPACRQLHMETIRPMMNEYVSSGKVYLVIRDFPLPQHAFGRTAARYANGSLKINKFRTVDDKLFETQPEWSTNGDIEKALAPVLTPAELTKLRAAANDPKLEDSMNSDVNLGKKVPISQTPTMVITSKGKTIPAAGFVTYPIFKRYLDNLLSQ